MTDANFSKVLRDAPRFPVEAYTPTISGDVVDFFRNLPKMVATQARGGIWISLVMCIVAIVMFFAVDGYHLSRHVPDLTGTHSALGVAVCALYFSIAIVGWLPATGGLIFLGASLYVEVTTDLSIRVPLWIFFVGSCLVIATWLSRGWIGMTAVAVICAPIAGALHTVFFTTQEPFVIALGSLTASLTIGGVLNQRRVEIEKLRAKATETEEQVHQHLVVALHDTTASDMTRMILSLESIVDRVDDQSTRDAIDEALGYARQAMRGLRSIIGSTAQMIPSLSQDPLKVIEQSRIMLAVRGIRLDAEYPEDLDSLGSRYIRELISLVIQEGTTNAVKYAAEHSMVTLTVEDLGTRRFEIIMKNQLSDQTLENDRTLRGGYGLTLLRQRIEEAGGHLVAGATDTTWMLVAELVVENGEEKAQQLRLGAPTGGPR